MKTDQLLAVCNHSLNRYHVSGVFQYFEGWLNKQGFRPLAQLPSGFGSPQQGGWAARPTTQSGRCLAGPPAVKSLLRLPRCRRPSRPRCHQARGTAAVRWTLPGAAWRDEYCWREWRRSSLGFTFRLCTLSMQITTTLCKTTKFK